MWLILLENPRPAEDVQAFLDRHPELMGALVLPKIKEPFHSTREEVERSTVKFLLAVQEAGKIYRHVVAEKARQIFYHGSFDG